MIKVMKGDEIQIVYTAKQDDENSTHEEKAIKYAKENDCKLVYEGEEPSKKVKEDKKIEEVEDVPSVDSAESPVKKSKGKKKK